MTAPSPVDFEKNSAQLAEKRQRDQREREERERANQRRKSELGRDLRAVMSTEEGGRVVLWLLDQTGVATELPGGRQPAGLVLFRLVQDFCPDEYRDALKARNAEAIDDGHR